MTPPKAEVTGDSARVTAAPPAVSLCLTAMRKRADFLRAAGARRQGTPGFMVQARARADGDPALRVGFTASKKIGNAVLRNRAKRRLREMARKVLPGLGRPGWDYVLVARPGATVTRDFAALLCDLESALRSIHKDSAP